MAAVPDAAPENIVKSNTSEFRAGEERPADATGQAENLEAAAKVRSGADWFFWIAGMSAINSIATLLGSSWQFSLGLGFTQVIDAVGMLVGEGGRALVLVANFLPLAFFITMGVHARRGRRWAFVSGMVAFVLDAVIILLFQDWIGAAFHGYALYRIYSGFRHIAALHQAPKAEAQPVAAA
jgi:hypothetical protein